MYEYKDTCQATKANCLPLSVKPEYIQAMRILDQISLRKRVTRNIALTPGSDIYRPDFTFSGIDDFRLVYVKVVSTIDLDKKASLKKLDLLIGARYNLIYSDGFNDLVQPDEAVFDVTIGKAYYPISNTKGYTKEMEGTATYITRPYEPFIELEASAGSFGDVLCSCSGALIVDIGAFFIIRFLQESEISVPAYKMNRGECI